MVSDRLLLNDKKTEFLLIGTRQQLSKVEPLPLRVEAMDIEPVNCVRNLGAWFDLVCYTAVFRVVGRSVA